MEIGFIGGGAMAEALIKGIIVSGAAKPREIFVSDHKSNRCAELHKKYDVNAMVGCSNFAGTVQVLFIAVKPQNAEDALLEAKPLVKPDTMIVSIVTGLTLEKMEQYFQTQPVIRVMPNTPAAVGEGISVYAKGTHVPGEMLEIVGNLLRGTGTAIQMTEYKFDAVTGLSGSGPAYAYLMIDALSDGGVAAGLKRSDAIILAAQTMLGAAKMVLKTGMHPDALRDQVTSPAGTTIAGVRTLEQHGVRGALIDAVIAASERSKELG